MTRLSRLAKNSKARIISIDANTKISTRLLELGAIPGAEVQMKGSAPMGGPIHVVLEGCHLSLNRKLADGIFVQE